jgi:hypothetical protein
VALTAKTPVDIILSLGPACRPAEQLRDSGLRLLSSPLDWMMNYSLETAAYLFHTKFESFFQDREIIPENYDHFYVRDVSNRIDSIHHFPFDKDIEAFYVATFRPTMIRRFNILNWFIRHSNHIAFIFNRTENSQNIVDVLSAFGEIYPRCGITFINIRTGYPPGTHETRRVNVSQKLELVEHFIDDTHTDGDHTAGNPAWWVGNVEMWQEILSTITLSYRSKMLFNVYKVAKKVKIGSIYQRRNKPL